MPEVGHYENFPVASRLVPARLRPAIVAVYRFARAADDLADEGDAPADTRLAALDTFERALDAIERGETPPLAPFPALAAVMRAHALPMAPFRALLSAFRQDVTTTCYATRDELLDYCARSANPVGRIMLALFDVDGADELRASDAICTGLQLANFWQDVAIDAAKGRIYLPEEDLVRFGVRAQDVLAGCPGPGWPMLMAFETEYTRTHFAAGRPLLASLPFRLRLEIGAVIAGGSRILDRIDAVRGDVFRCRPTLNRVDWAAVALRALFPARPAPGSAA